MCTNNHTWYIPVLHWPCADHISDYGTVKSYYPQLIYFLIEGAHFSWLFHLAQATVRTSYRHICRVYSPDIFGSSVFQNPPYHSQPTITSNPVATPKSVPVATPSAPITVPSVLCCTVHPNKEETHKVWGVKSKGWAEHKLHQYTNCYTVIDKIFNWIATTTPKVKKKHLKDHEVHTQSSGTLIFIKNVIIHDLLIWPTIQ